MADGDDASTLADLRISVANWYQKRLLTFFSRTLNQGLGAFLIFSVSLTVAAITLRIVCLGGAQDRDQVSKMMQTLIQPQSDPTTGAVLALLLAGLQDQDAPDLVCGKKLTGACRLGQSLWTQTQANIDAVDELIVESLASCDFGVLAQSPMLHREPKELQQELLVNASLRCALNPLGTSVSDYAQDWWQRLPASAVACDDPKEVEERAKEFQFAKPICFGGPSSRTVEIIPYQVAEAFGQDSPSAAIMTRQISRVRRAHLDSALFALALESVVGESKSNEVLNESTSVLEGPAIAAAFFISFDSVLRYWTRGLGLEAKDLPAYRLWAARPYVENMLRLEKPALDVFETTPYMDFAGHGIVYTQCRPLLEQALGNVAQRVRIGALCIDYMLSGDGLAKLVAIVNRGPITDAIVATLNGSQIVPNENPPPSWATSPAVTAGLNKAAIELKSNSMRRNISSIGDDPSSSHSGIFLVPSGMNVDGNLSVILIRVTGIGALGSRPISLLVSAAFVAIALVALASGFIGSREVARRERLVGRLRSLQVAVIQTDGDDRISAGNDRAEDLLGMSLPHFGIAASKLHSFWSVFDERSLLSHGSEDSPSKISFGPVPDDPTRLAIYPGDAAQIRIQRELGKTSTYFLKLINPAPIAAELTGVSREWLRITAGPILKPNLRSGPIEVTDVDRKRRNKRAQQATFGVLETVPTSIESILERKLVDKFAGSPSASPAPNHGDEKAT